jgi:hypothetical protein
LGYSGKVQKTKLNYGYEVFCIDVLAHHSRQIMGFFMFVLTVLSFISFGTVTGVMCALFCVFVYYHFIKSPFHMLDKDGGAPDTIPSDGVNTTTTPTPTVAVAVSSPKVTPVVDAKVTQKSGEGRVIKVGETKSAHNAKVLGVLPDAQMLGSNGMKLPTSVSDMFETGKSLPSALPANVVQGTVVSTSPSALPAKVVQGTVVSTSNPNPGQNGGGGLRPKWLRKLKQLANVLPG